MSGSGFANVRARLSALGAILCAAVLASGVLASSVQAAGEFEPNDTRETAYGPLEGGKWYTAEFETENDVDWYVVYIKTYSQMEFSGMMLAGSTCTGNIRFVELIDADGHGHTSFYLGQPEKIDRLSLTLDAGRYYLKFRNLWRECTGDRYKFRIDPAAAITTSPECGESIVARDAALPQLADVEAKMKQNGDLLHKARLAVKRAQRKLNRAQRALRRAKKVRRSRWRVRSVRIRVRTAKRERGRAGEAKRGVARERAQLGAVRRQHLGVIVQADSLIATYC